MSTPQDILWCNNKPISLTPLSIKSGMKLIVKEHCYFNIFSSAHRTSNYMSPKYFVCLLFEYFFQTKVINQYQNTPKNANITRHIKKKKQTLCNTLNLGNWNSGFQKFGVWWAQRDIKEESCLKFILFSCGNAQKIIQILASDRHSNLKQQKFFYLTLSSAALWQNKLFCKIS